jgi:uncharacterized protein (TIGR02594 family)
MPTLLEVWESRLGIEEVSGKKHNPVILEWWMDAGHPEIIDDETAWCSGAMCSAAKAAGLPFPPVNVNTMARSWLTMGKGVSPAEVQPGDVVVWPRGKPNSGSGHVNCVKEVRRTKTSVKVKCIGGNQSHPSGGAVTVTDWTDLSGALSNGIRRLVPATVPALREAGSTTIKNADRKEKLGILAVFFAPIVKGIEYVANMFGPPDVPTFATLPEGLTWWQTVLGAANGIWGYAVDHPYLAATLVAGLALWGISRIEKAGRVAEHAAGIPIAAEVAKLEAA